MPTLSRRTLLAAGAATLTTAAMPRACAAPVSTVRSFAVPALPLATAEIPNSGRGMNDWLGVPADPADWPLVDSYRRPDGAWKTIEIRPGVYDWSILDKALDEAQQRGGRLTWRIMPWYFAGARAEAPSWIPMQTIQPRSGGPSFTCPDWNSPGYISSWIKLMESMGEHADNDPRLWAVDISGFGAWGEHYWDEQNWGPRMSRSNFELIATAVRDAFPQTWVLGPAMDPGFSVMPEVFGAEDRWGTRYDYLGGQEMDLSPLDGYRNLWKHGPVVTEWAPSAEVTMSMGLRNVRSMHVSVLSSGNRADPYTVLSPDEKAAFVEANKIAGYRLSLDSIKAPTSWRAGQRVTMQTTWTNHGVAPTYDPWRLELMMGDRAVPVAGDLRTLLPGTTTLTHTFTARTNTAPLGIRAVDPQGYLSPVRLANAGRRTDGSYPVATRTS